MMERKAATSPSMVGCMPTERIIKKEKKKKIKNQFRKVNKDVLVLI